MLLRWADSTPRAWQPRPPTPPMRQPRRHTAAGAALTTGWPRTVDRRRPCRGAGFNSETCSDGIPLNSGLIWARARPTARNMRFTRAEGTFRLYQQPAISLDTRRCGRDPRYENILACAQVGKQPQQSSTSADGALLARAGVPRTSWTDKRSPCFRDAPSGWADTASFGGCCGPTAAATKVRQALGSRRRGRALTKLPVSSEIAGHFLLRVHRAAAHGACLNLFAGCCRTKGPCVIWHGGLQLVV
eukprot:364730-Chlamydomonas_euryale.AAC.2